MKHSLIYAILIVALLGACAPVPSPQPTADIAATSQAISATSVAATLTAQPTATLLPTGTPTLPAPTITPIATKTRRVRPTKTAKPAYVPFSGCLTPTGVTNLTAPFKIENMTPNRVSVFINGMTNKGEHPVNCAYTLKSHTNVIFTIWWGDYTYIVQVAGKTTYQGSFWVNNEDKATMRVTNKGIKLGPFP